MDDQVDDDYLETISISVKLLMSKLEKEGEMSFEDDVHFGYKHEVSLNTKFSAKASVETSKLASFAGGKFSGEMKSEISAGYAFNFDSTSTTKRSFTMVAGTPGYIYQFTSSGTTTSGVFLEWAGGLMMTTSPFEIRESETLLKGKTIYWLDHTNMMRKRGDDGDPIPFHNWNDCLQKAKDNLKPGMGAVAAWTQPSQKGGKLYIKKKIPEMSRDAGMYHKPGYTSFWLSEPLAPALDDKIKEASHAPMPPFVASK